MDTILWISFGKGYVNFWGTTLFLFPFIVETVCQSIWIEIAHYEPFWVRYGGGLVIMGLAG